MDYEPRIGDRVRTADELADDLLNYMNPLPAPGTPGTITAIAGDWETCVCDVQLDSGETLWLFDHELEFWYRPANDPSRYGRMLL